MHGNILLSNYVRLNSEEKQSHKHFFTTIKLNFQKNWKPSNSKSYSIIHLCVWNVKGVKHRKAYVQENQRKCLQTLWKTRAEFSFHEFLRDERRRGSSRAFRFYVILVSFDQPIFFSSFYFFLRNYSNDLPYNVYVNTQRTRLVRR